MNRTPTLLLKGLLLLMGLAAIAFCVVLPMMLGIGREAHGPLAGLRVPILLGLYACALAFLAALHQAYRLLTNIEKGSAFTDASIRALKGIGLCAGIICAVFVCGGLPLMYYLAQLEDAPGLVLIGIFIAVIPYAVTVFARVFQLVLQDGMRAKEGRPAA